MRAAVTAVLLALAAPAAAGAPLALGERQVLALEFQQAVARVVGNSRDPLPLASKAMLAEIAQHGSLSFDDATQLLPNLVCCFDRQHQEPRWSDYQTLGDDPATVLYRAHLGPAITDLLSAAPGVDYRWFDDGLVVGPEAAVLYSTLPPDRSRCR